MANRMNDCNAQRTIRRGYCILQVVDGLGEGKVDVSEPSLVTVSRAEGDGAEKSSINFT